MHPFSWLGRRRPGLRDANSIPILLYHRFDSRQALTPWTVVTEKFAAQVRWLTQHSRPVPLRAAIDTSGTTEPTDLLHAVSITVDDGDASVFTEMFPVIRAYGLPVTLFVCPYSISRSPTALTWALLRQMVNTGLVDVQFHTATHPNFHYERDRRTPGDYEALIEFELTHGRSDIEERLGLKVDLLAWPYGIYDSELEESAARLGYAAAFAVKTNGPSKSKFAISRVSVSDRHTDEDLSRLFATHDGPVL
jgi:peptidoglycan/xylan/chitin deacetylase (PgdA/CDA1 family)